MLGNQHHQQISVILPVLIDLLPGTKQLISGVEPTWLIQSGCAIFSYPCWGFLTSSNIITVSCCWYQVLSSLGQAATSGRICSCGSQACRGSGATRCIGAMKARVHSSISMLLNDYFRSSRIPCRFQLDQHFTYRSNYYTTAVPHHVKYIYVYINDMYYV